MLREALAAAALATAASEAAALVFTNSLTARSTFFAANTVVAACSATSLANEVPPSTARALARFGCARARSKAVSF